MNSLPIASRMARDATERKLTAPARAAAPRRPRRAAAVALETIAHRLDPCVVARARPQITR